MYEFATGVINVWEKRLLSGLDQERMLKAPDRKSAFIVLFDTDLGELIAGNPQKSIEDIFGEDLILLKKKLSIVLDDKELLISFLFLKFDAFNLKFAVKKYYCQVNEKSFKPFDFSISSYKLLEEFLRIALNKDFDKNKLFKIKLNTFAEKLVLATIKTLNDQIKNEKSVSSQEIETAVDKAYFKVKKEMAKKHKALMEMVKLEIDMANLRSLLAKDRLLFLEGGNLSVLQVEKLAQKKEEDMGNNLKKFVEFLEIAFLLEDSKENNDNIVIEKKLEGYMAQKIFQKEKEKGSGIEKVLAFFQKKINSYVNIRLILFAKENGITTQEIEKSLLPIR